MGFDDHPQRCVRVLIVDDTRTMRALIRSRIEGSGAIEVVGEAGDPIEAQALIRKLNPDVLTLDIEMPKMDGLAFLERLMRRHPMPVVMVSSRTTENSHDAIKALSLGAVDCVDIKRLKGATPDIDLIGIVLLAADSNVHRKEAGPIRRPKPASSYPWNGKSVLIGSSTGGVDALLTVLGSFPADGPATLIAQHMPASFLKSFCARLDKNTAPRVLLAEDASVMEQGCVYLAPGGTTHAVLSRRDPQKICLLDHDETEPFVPSVNLMFSSAEIHANRCIGVMLTGMGNDGAEALLRMRQAGAHTIVQDRESSVVDGMPKSARALGAASEIGSLNTIGERILKSASWRKQET